MQTKSLLVAVTLTVFATGIAHADVSSSASVERTGPTSVTVRWSDRAPVDVFLAKQPVVAPAKAELISQADADGVHVATVGAGDRPYFLLRSKHDGRLLRVAERALPLAQGSNFRDLGGYPAADGKRVKWGLIFRSGGTPLLTDADLEQVGHLQLREMFDLRSSEERVLAPTRISGIRYSSVGYSMASLIADSSNGFRDPGIAYRRFPALLAPQAREIFASLVRGDAPLAYSCAAGQDRTGFMTAMILTALGVPREAVYEDYHLSTTYRRPQYEVPKIDTRTQAGNPVAMLFARYQADPNYAQPKPLYGPEQKPLLAFAFEEIDQRWGSVNAYLAKEVGLDAGETASLRQRYLE
jgi:protein-tyrosine phosphatase